MGPAEEDELAELRRRVYGRDSAPDPDALARLSALESRPRPSVEGSVEDRAAPDGPDPVDPSAPDASEEAGTPVDAPQARSRRRPLLLAALAALAATGVLAVGAALGTAATAPPGREVAVLPLTSGTDIPGWEGLGFDGSVTTPDFGGLTVVRQGLSGDGGLTDVRQRGAADDGSCLYIVRTVDPRDGLFFQGCTAGAFPAVAQFTVTSDAPQQLRQDYPIGTALRFTLDGDEIRVRSDAP